MKSEGLLNENCLEQFKNGSELTSFLEQLRNRGIEKILEVNLIPRCPGGSMTDALDKLNDIRFRAGVPLKSFVDKATLLEDIRLEKSLELYCETGENWFDLVRYDQLGDIDASFVKPTITSDNKLIFPIPNNALLGNTLLIQNP
ncbi:RagB/SusD family nutrient uptake outer membrane protein [Flavobacteriaceae bacterium F08102]|nr:RagB/SusD family nutrient uptake outer membrane protein [Flavobacteriaceae bacterium F08102]